MNFGSLGGGGLLESIMSRLGAGAAPAVPADGTMQSTIGPGAAPAPTGQGLAYKPGLPPGGILGLLRGQSPQGLAGLLKNHLSGPPAQQPLSSYFGQMPQAGMLPGMPGSPMAGPMAPLAAAPQLPTDINPMNQF